MRGDGAHDQRIVALVTLGLVAFGLVMVYSATSASAALGNGDPMSFLKRQARVRRSSASSLMTIASRFDYHRLRYLAPPLLLASFVLCAAVLVVGPAINGAQPLVRARAGELPALRAREARALRLRCRLPRASAAPRTLRRAR